MFVKHENLGKSTPPYLHPALQSTLQPLSPHLPVQQHRIKQSSRLAVHLPIWASKSGLFSQDQKTRIRRFWEKQCDKKNWYRSSQINKTAEGGGTCLKISTGFHQQIHGILSSRQHFRDTTMVAFLSPNAHPKKKTFEKENGFSMFLHMLCNDTLPQSKTTTTEGYSRLNKKSSWRQEEFTGGGRTYKIGTFLTLLSFCKWIIQLALLSMRHQDTGERARKATFTPLLVRASRSALSSSKVESIDMLLDG